MKILVAARHFGYLRNFELALVELATRGHQLHLVADREENAGGLQMVERLAARFPRVTIGWTPRRDRNDQWLEVATRIRLSQDYLRYLHRIYNKAPMLRRRAKERTPALAVWLVERAGFRYRPGRRVLDAVLRALEDGVPLHEPYTALLRDVAPDVVVLTPLIDLGSPQLDMLKSARALGLRTVLAVGSWDHLSSKALIRLDPDLVTVWNEIQKREAIDMQGVPAGRIVVTGAQCYDQWFDRTPRRSREAFCRDMGLPADRPFVLYVCSSLFRGDPPEADFTVRWIRAVRESRDPRLDGVGILVRPHPGRLDEWKGHEVASLGVAFHGSNPIDDEARDDYFDALHYSAAVVGLNTSAFLEAGIAGKPVLAILPKEIWKSQEGTLHFHYLLDVGGGLLRTSRSIEEHVPQLAAAVSGEAPADNSGFVREFIRPYGLDAPGSPRLAEAIEALGGRPAPGPWRAGLAGRAARPLLQSRLALRRLRAWWHRWRKDAQHDLRKTRDRALRAVRRPLKQWSERGLGLRWQVFVPRTDRRQAWARNGMGHEAAEETRQAVTLMRSTGRPIVVGPWLSETGFELLYWIPFVRWAQRYGHLRPGRVVAISRGGAAPWYHGLADRYVDVFDLVSLEEFREGNDRRILAQDGQKHYEATGFDREIVRRAVERLGLPDHEWLHPGLMYSLFRAVWLQLAPFDLARAFTVPRALSVAREPRLPDLPARYIAVKFYTNQALPQDPANERFVTGLLDRLGRRGDLVLLQTGLALDDHGEFTGGAPGHIHRVDHLMTPSNNLEIQTRVIAGADALVTTYGGFSYLGPLLGVKTLAFYSNPFGFRMDHLDVARRMFREVSGGPFLALRTSELAPVEDLLGAAQMAEVQ